MNILITGASRGIGLALSTKLAARGHRVITTARHPEGSQGLVDLARHSENRVTAIALDVTQSQSIEAAAGAVEKSVAHLDLLVNNAGVFPEEGGESFESLNFDWFGIAFDTNVVGTARVCRRFLPLLRKSEAACVVNVSSGAGSIGGKTSDTRRYCYGVSKAALNMLTRTLAEELRAEKIAVIAISPGWVNTDMGGPNAELSVEESSSAMAKTIENLGMADTSQFLNRFGERGEYEW